MTLEEKFINEISLCHCPNCNKMIDDIVKSDPDQCSSMCCPHCKTMFCKACKYYITKEAAINYMKIGNIDAIYTEGKHEMIVHSHIWRKHPNQGIYLRQEYIENSHKKEIIHKIQLFSAQLSESEKIKVWNNETVQEYVNTIIERFDYERIL